jgi:hypothetical protein
MLFLHLAGCGGQFSDIKGKITSPYYPDLYENDMECIYTISAIAEATITITFKFLSIEYHPRCHYDSIRVCIT